MLIPEFRALSKESKKEIFGFLIGVDEESNLCAIRTEDDVLGGELCFLDTLCIHFPDMKDINNIKIFASLGGGFGDNITCGDDENSERLNYSSREMIPYFLDFNDFKKI